VKPVYDTDGPLESMDDIIIPIDREAMELTTEMWENLRDTPPFGVPLQKIGGGLFRNLAYTFGLF
jgi:hypothetical protein